MLTHLAVRNFKRFESVEIELGGPVMFYGPVSEYGRAGFGEEPRTAGSS